MSQNYSFGLVSQDRSYTNFAVSEILAGEKGAFQDLEIGGIVTLAGPTETAVEPYTWHLPNLNPATLVSGQVLTVEAVLGEQVYTQWQDSSDSKAAVIQNFIRVSPVPILPGQYYPTLTEAVAYILTQSPGPTNRWTIHVFPGIYEEPDTVTIPSFVTVNGDFGLSVVITTLGSGPILKASNRCDIYNVVLQGPTAAGQPGLLADDADIGFFLGNCRIVGCDIGVLLRPAISGKTVFLYLRDCLFNGNFAHQLLADTSTTAGTFVNIFSWNNVFFAPSQGFTSITDPYGPLVQLQGPGTVHQNYSADFEREASQVLGTALVIQDGASLTASGSNYNWFAVGAQVVNDGTTSSLTSTGAQFHDCDVDLIMANVNTTGSLTGAIDFAKVQVVYGTLWYISNRSPNVVTVGPTKASDFQDLNAAIAYVTTYSPPPSGSNRFTIALGPYNYSTATTLVVPDYCDIVGAGISQTTITITTQNTDLIHAGYNSLLSAMTLYGYGTNPVAPNLFTATGSTSGYGILYAGTSSFTTIGYINNIQLGNFWISIGVKTSPALFNVTQFQTLRFLGYRNTHTHLEIDAGTGTATAIGLRDSRYSPTFVNGVPGNFTYFCSMTGGSPTAVNACTFDTLNVRCGGTDTGLPSGNPLKFGTGFYVNQGSLSLRNTEIVQLNVGFHVPIGAVPTLAVYGSSVTTCNTGLLVESSTAIGYFQGIMDRLLLNCISPNFGLLLTEPDGQGSVIVGGIYQAPTSLIQAGTVNTASNISPQINQVGTVGVLSGGVLTVTGGTTVNVTAGTGYVMVGSVLADTLQFVQFLAQSGTLTANQSNYVAINNLGTLQITLTAPDELAVIFLGQIVMNGSTVLYIDQGTDAYGPAENIRHLPSALNSALETQFGAIAVSGLIVTNSGLQLAMSQGTYYVGATRFQPLAISLGTSFSGLYFGGAGPIVGTWTATSLTQTPLQWNNAGTLTALIGGQFAKHAIYVCGAGTNQIMFLIYSITTYASSVLADAGALPAPPAFFGPEVILLAAVVTDNTAIIHILDQRPTLVSRSGAVLATNNHSALLNLGADDHLQYFRTDGTRVMTGAINTGNNNIVVGTGLVDGVVVHAHAARHLPGGADPLTTAAPIPISALSNSEGVAGAFARSDHLHAHGVQTDPTLHALATGANAGFLSSSFFSLLNTATATATPSTLVLRDASRDTNLRNVGLVDPVTFTNTVALGAQSGTAAYSFKLPTSAGTIGQVLQTDGAGNTSWGTASKIFAYDTTTQTVLSANVFQDIVFSTNVILAGWTHTAGTANFTCLNSGDYQVTYTATGNTAGGTNRAVEIVGVNNGSQVAGSRAITVLSQVTTISGSFLVTMTSTQILKLQLTGNNVNSQLVTGTGNATVKPSISMTVTRVL